MRIKYLCVSKGKVVEIPVSKIKNSKMIKTELSGETVLMMEMIYETENRKPFKIGKIHFDKVTFNQDGIYDIQATSTKYFQIKLEYAFSDIHNTIESKSLPIPIAPCIPTEEEIQAIKIYIDRKYPFLLINSPRVIENSISKSKEIHKEEIKKFKESHRNKAMGKLDEF
ncbi:Uncharacterised protein [Mycobacteroides abscessus subsp. abscessus]|nr:Uncharacterised protein [Mycobacteroides abscessus subsp. abscessus]